MLVKSGRLEESYDDPGSTSYGQEGTLEGQGPRSDNKNEQQGTHDLLDELPPQG